MKKTIAGLAAATVLAGSLVAFAPSANAQNGRVAAGVAGGLIGGMLLGSAIANANQPPPPPPGYYRAPPAYYVQQPVCQIVQQQYWDGFMWRVRNMQVCN
jgi:hypothetical protein